MNKQTFIQKALDWAAIVEPDIKAHKRVCIEEFNELKKAVNAYRHNSRSDLGTGLEEQLLDAQKEYADVLWTYAILKHLNKHDPFLGKMLTLLEECSLFKDDTILDAVAESNFSKFVLADRLDIKEAQKAVYAIKEKYKGRYEGVHAVQKYGYWLFLDSNNKVMKPLSYRDYREFL